MAQGFGSNEAGVDVNGDGVINVFDLVFRGERFLAFRHDDYKCTAKPVKLKATVIPKLYLMVRWTLGHVY